MPSLQTAAGAGFGTINKVHTTAFGSRDTMREISSTSNTLKIEETVREIYSLQFLGNSHLNFGHKGLANMKVISAINMIITNALILFFHEVQGKFWLIFYLLIFNFSLQHQNLKSMVER